MEEIKKEIKKILLEDLANLNELKEDERKSKLDEVCKLVDKLGNIEKNEIESKKIEVEGEKIKAARGINLVDIIGVVNTPLMKIFDIVTRRNELMKILEFEENGKIVSKPGREWKIFR